MAERSIGRGALSESRDVFERDAARTGVLGVRPERESKQILGLDAMRMAVAGMVMGVILAGVIAIGMSASMRMMRMSGSVMGVSLMFFAPGWMNVGLCMWMSVMRAMGVAGGAMRMEAPALTGARFRGCGDLLVAKRPNLDLLVRERWRDWSSDGRRGKSGDDADKEGRTHAGPLDVII